MHQCIFVCDSFHSSYVHMRVKISQVVHCCFSPSQFMLLPLLLVESWCAYFSVTASNHRVSRDFIVRFAISSTVIEFRLEMKFPRMFDIKQQQMLTESVIQFGGKSAGSSKLIIERFFSSPFRSIVEPLIAFSALEMHIRAK